MPPALFQPLFPNNWTIARVQPTRLSYSTIDIAANPGGRCAMGCSCDGESGTGLSLGGGHSGWLLAAFTHCGVPNPYISRKKIAIEESGQN